MSLRTIVALAAMATLAAGTVACRPDGGGAPTVADAGATSAGTAVPGGPTGEPSAPETVVEPPPPALPVIRGDIYLRERVSLPPRSTAKVRIVRLGGGDRVTAVVASAEVEAPRQMPIPFELTVDPADLEPGGRCALQAEIVHGGTTVFETPAPVLMELRGSSVSGVKLLLRRVGEPPRRPAASDVDSG